MPAGLGTAADRALEEAIKGSPLSATPQSQNPWLRCVACYTALQHKVLPPQVDTQVVESRRSMRRTSKWGAGGDETKVLDQYNNTDSGQSGTLEWRRFISSEEGERISYWHDLPLAASATTLHAFIEIPKDSRAKYEMCPTEPTNPIKQDEKNGKPRNYNLDIKWNYGAFPQTWEQPDHEWKGLEGYGGDDDPVDVVDISSFSVPTGSVIVCKPLAALAMIDDGEVDWKVIVINAKDPIASQVGPTTATTASARACDP